MSFHSFHCTLVYVYLHGSGTFRSQVFSLLGAKVPSASTFAPKNESSRELSLPGAKVPGNFRSRERMFLGTFVPGSDIAGE